MSLFLVNINNTILDWIDVMLCQRQFFKIFFFVFCKSHAGWKRHEGENRI